MPSKKFHKNLIFKLKTALQEARDCFEFYRVLARRTVELNHIPLVRYRAGLNRWSTPVDNILHILRKSNNIKKYNPLQEGVVVKDTYRYAVPRLRPDYVKYSMSQNTVKIVNLIIPQNETREVVDIITDNDTLNYPPVFTIRAKKGAQVTYYMAVFGSKEITKNITLELDEGAEGRIVGVILATGDAKFKIKTTLHHKGEHTKGDIKIKVVLKDQARVSYDGMIKIAKTANQTNSYLSGKALALNRGVSCDACPELEIEANDVKASHSFSQGQIDEEQLFYLCSRGLTYTEAKQMIVEGFLMDVVERLDKSTKIAIKQQIDFLL